MSRYLFILLLLVLAYALASVTYFLTPLAKWHCIAAVESAEIDGKDVDEFLEEISANGEVAWHTANYNSKCVVRADVNGRTFEWVKVYWDSQIYANNTAAEKLGFPLSKEHQVLVNW